MFFFLIYNFFKGTFRFYDKPVVIGMDIEVVWTKPKLGDCNESRLLCIQWRYEMNKFNFFSESSSESGERSGGGGDFFFYQD